MHVLVRGPCCVCVGECDTPDRESGLREKQAIASSPGSPNATALGSGQHCGGMENALPARGPRHSDQCFCHPCDDHALLRLRQPIRVEKGETLGTNLSSLLLLLRWCCGSAAIGAGRRESQREKERPFLPESLLAFPSFPLRPRYTAGKTCSRLSAIRRSPCPPKSGGDIQTARDHCRPQWLRRSEPLASLGGPFVTRA
jgi:hypothetical protein